MPLSHLSGVRSLRPSLYSPKVPRLTLRCRVYLALPAEQAAEGKQAQQQLAALVHGADKPTNLVRVRVGVGVGVGVRPRIG